MSEPSICLRCGGKFGLRSGGTGCWQTKTARIQMHNRAILFENELDPDPGLMLQGPHAHRAYA